MSILSIRDRDRLKGVHEDLIHVVEFAFGLFPDAFKDTPSFRVFVIQGLRTREQQAEYVRIGASHTMNSRHLTGHAVDLGVQEGGAMRWEFPVYEKLWETCVLPAAVKLGVNVEWGGKFRTSKGKPIMDGPHFQLSQSKYV